MTWPLLLYKNKFHTTYIYIFFFQILMMIYEADFQISNNLVILKQKGNFVHIHIYIKKKRKRHISVYLFINLQGLHGEKGAKNICSRRVLILIKGPITGVGTLPW